MSDTPTQPTPLLPFGSPALDAGGAVADDFHCTHCRYNLRTLTPGEKCPECGQVVQKSIDDTVAGFGRDDGSAYCMSLFGRLMYLLAGAVLPIGCCLLAAARVPEGPTWQRNNWTDLVRLTLGRWPLLALLPLMVFAIQGLMLVVLVPHRYATSRWTRAAVYSGVPLALHFLIVESFLVSGEETESLPVIVLIYLLIAAALVGVSIAITKLKTRVTRKMRTVLGWLTLGGGVLLVVPGSLVSVVTSASWTLAAYTLLSIRLWRTPCESRTPWTFWALWAAGWGASTAAAIHLAMLEYAKLPLVRPDDCYVCTAAARGHRRLTGGEEFETRDGRGVRVTTQMRRLKAAEIALAVAWPRGHRACRWLYNRVGPQMARAMVHPLLADAAYLSLKPFEWASAVCLRALVPGAARLVRELYAPRA